MIRRQQRIRKAFRVLGGIVTWPLSLIFRCRHKHVTLPFNNYQTCIDCGAKRVYLYNSNFTAGTAGVYRGPWRPARTPEREAAALARIAADVFGEDLAVR